MKILRRTKIRRFVDWFYSWLSKPPKYVLLFGEVQLHYQNLKQAEKGKERLGGEIIKII